MKNSDEGVSKRFCEIKYSEMDLNRDDLCVLDSAFVEEIFDNVVRLSRSLEHSGHHRLPKETFVS